MNGNQGGQNGARSERDESWVIVKRGKDGSPLIAPGGVKAW